MQHVQHVRSVPGQLAPQFSLVVQTQQDVLLKVAGGLGLAQVVQAYLGVLWDGGRCKVGGINGVLKVASGLGLAQVVQAYLGVCVVGGDVKWWGGKGVLKVAGGPSSRHIQGLWSGVIVEGGLVIPRVT